MLELYIELLLMKKRELSFSSETGYPLIAALMLSRHGTANHILTEEYFYCHV